MKEERERSKYILIMIYNFINKYKHFYHTVGLIFDFFHTPLALSHHQTHLFDVSSSFIVAVVFAYIYIHFPSFYSISTHTVFLYIIYIHKHTHICHFYITSIVNKYFFSKNTFYISSIFLLACLSIVTSRPYIYIYIYNYFHLIHFLYNIINSFMDTSEYFFKDFRFTWEITFND